MATAGTAFFIADCICQRYVENKTTQEYSLKRSVRQSSVGVFFAGPSLHIWHTMIIPKIAQRFSSKPAKILASIVSTETAFGMYFVCSLLFYFEVLKTQSVEAGVRSVENKFWPTFGNSLKFWPFVSAINFSLIPIHLRSIFVNFFAIIWQTYLSYVSNNKATNIGAVLSDTEKNIVADIESANTRGV